MSHNPRRVLIAEEVAVLVLNQCVEERNATDLEVSTGAVEKHANNIYSKLRLAQDSRDHRRVLALLCPVEGGR